MRQVNSTDFKTHFGEFVRLVKDEPIAVLQRGNVVGVFLSAAEYEYLANLENLYWVARARAQEIKGSWVSDQEAIQILIDQMNTVAL